jgi:ribosomal protein S19E (S16A)
MIKKKIKRKVTKQSVIRLVEKHLNAVGHGIKFEILEAGVRADEDWWYVPVLSTLRGQDVKRDITVSIFANIENDLHNTEGLTVLLVPVVD